MKYFILSLFFVLLLSGCISVGPEYAEPEAEVETDWIKLDESLVTNAPPADASWWKSAFEDAELNKLVDLAL